MVGYRYHGIAPYLLDLGTSRRAGYSRMKDIIYEGFDRAQVDTVFDTLQKRSVRCRKEIEEFKDVREEWLLRRRVE
jgi:hypothetical protein